jgi:hypothetical protein
VSTLHLSRVNTSTLKEVNAVGGVNNLAIDAKRACLLQVNNLLSLHQPRVTLVTTFKVQTAKSHLPQLSRTKMRNLTILRSFVKRLTSIREIMIKDCKKKILNFKRTRPELYLKPKEPYKIVREIERKRLRTQSEVLIQEWLDMGVLLPPLESIKVLLVYRVFTVAIKL